MNKKIGLILINFIELFFNYFYVLIFNLHTSYHNF